MEHQGVITLKKIKMQLSNLTTSRLILQKVDQSVMDYVFSNLSPMEQMDFLGCKSVDELQEQERKHKDGLSTYNKKYLYFFLRTKYSNIHIGWCGYHTWYTDHLRAEIGYGINEEYRRQGLMTEAVKEILDFGFKEMNLHRVEAFLSMSNTPSVRLMEIFGFKKEGMLREHYRVKGINEDSAVFSLLKNERNNFSD